MPKRQPAGMKDRWPVIIFTTLLTLAVGIQVVETLAAGMTCQATLEKVAKSEAICGPVEFWVNRYQSAWTALLTTSVAIAAALAAWLAVKGQIAEARYQSTIAHWQSLTATTRAMARDIHLADRISGTTVAIAGTIKYGKARAISQNRIDRSEQHQSGVIDSMFEFQSSGNEWSRETEILRRDARKALQEMTIITRKLLNEVKNNNWKPENGYGSEFLIQIESAESRLNAQREISRKFVRVANAERDEILTIADKLRRAIISRATAG